jgi:hypothetical protein
MRLPHKNKEDGKRYRDKWRSENKDKWAAYHKKWREANPEKHKQNYSSLSPEYKIWYAIKSKCKKNNIEFDLDVSDIDPPKLCPVFNIPLDRRDSNHTPSVDRVDPSKGYTKDNICVISLKANRMKQDSSIDDLKMLIKYMEEH